MRLYFFVGIGYNDDSYYLEFAEKIYKKMDLVPPRFVHWGIRMGVYFPVVIAWKIFSINEFSTSLFFILCSLGSIFSTYLIGKELFSREVGLISAFLLAIFPLNIIYSTQVGPDIPFQFFSSLSVLFLIKSEKIVNFKKSTINSFLSGVFLGISYLFKEMIPLMVLLLGIYVILNNISKRKKLMKLLNKKNLIKYITLAFGIILIFTLQVIYFYRITGELFFGEKARKHAFTHDRNSNSDLMWYPRVMFNYKARYFQWIHNVPLFGFTYYFVVISIIYLLIKERKIEIIFLVFWVLLFFSFFEYGLQFFCTKIMEYCLYPRHPRFLSVFSIPSMILVGKFLEFKGKSKKKIFSLVILTFLTTTSLIYSYQSSIFLGNGMNDIQESVEFIQTLPLKTLYVPDSWSISKLKFFFKYNETFVDNIKIYDCRVINCADPYYDNGEFISDAYVITWLNPYNQMNQDHYPKFMKEPPKNWKLIKTVSLKNYRIFDKYDPKIFEVG